MKYFFKTTAFYLCSAAVSPLLATCWLETRRGSSERHFQGVAQLLSLLPFRLGTYVRAAFFKNSCNGVDREITIGFLTLLSHRDINLGKHVYIGPQSNIGTCSIGQDCLLGSGVHILSGKKQHKYNSHDRPIREQKGEYEKVTIGRNCWIGNNATILANIGDNCIVGAGSVVTNQIPSNSIAAGNPAKVLKENRQTSTQI